MELAAAAALETVMPFIISAMKSQQAVSFQLDTATEALAKFYNLYEHDFLNVRISNRRGRRLSVDDLIGLVALQKAEPYA
jgi:hypothetical protein